MDQFHIADKSHRKQRYYLNFLEHCDPTDTKRHLFLTSPLQAVVESNCYELIMHPLFQRLIEVKWQFFGMRAWLGIFLNVLLTVAYTVLGITHPTDVDNYYFPFSKNGWRIPLETLVMILTFNEIRKEVKDVYQSRRENNKIITWRENEIKRDLQFCHPRWTQEETFIKQHVQHIKERKRSYFQDRWNYIDWVTYAMLIIVIILHVINVAVQSNKYNDVFIRIFACTIILVWLRLLKFVRPFPAQGPFVVILGKILEDTFRWAFVIAMFYIPYAIAFWMLFGGRSKHPVRGYDTFFHLTYTILQYPLVSNYGFDDLEEVAPIMTRVLCGTFLMISAVVLMNMYIALLSNTFQRVYDNARATATMQRARLLRDLESDATKKTARRYREHLRTMCCPEESDYLVIISDEEDQKRKEAEKIALVHTIVNERLGGKMFGKVEKSEFDIVLEDINLMKQCQSEMQKSLDRQFLRLKKHGKTQMSAITGVNEEVARLKINVEERFESLESSVKSKLQNIKKEAKLRTSALESHISTSFDQLESEFKDVSSRYDEYDQEMTARVEDLEAYISTDGQGRKTPKRRAKTEKTLFATKTDKSNSMGGFQIVEADRSLVKDIDFNSNL